MTTTTRPPLTLTLLMWFAVIGAPAATVVQFAVGFVFDQTACNGPGRDIPIDVAAGIASGLAALVAVLAWLSAAAALRATKDVVEDDAPPDGRVHFLAVVGLTISPLFLAIILFDGVGMLILPGCVQS